MSLHVKNGWYFRRIPETGAVEIVKRDLPEYDSAVVAETTLSADEWVTLMLAMSSDPHNWAWKKTLELLHQGMKP